MRDEESDSEKVIERNKEQERSRKSVRRREEGVTNSVLDVSMDVDGLS